MTCAIKCVYFTVWFLVMQTVHKTLLATVCQIHINTDMQCLFIDIWYCHQ